MKVRFAVGCIAAVLMSGAAGTRVVLGRVNIAATSRVKIVSNKGRDAYTLLLGDHWMSTNQSIEEMEKVRARYDGDFLWLRRHGKTYVVRDRVKLDEARGLFDALRVLEPTQTD